MFRRLDGKIAFPALPIFQPKGSQWMTDEQERLTTIYGWTSLSFIAFFALVFVWRIYKLVAKVCYGGYKVSPVDHTPLVEFCAFSYAQLTRMLHRPYLNGIRGFLTLFVL